MSISKPALLTVPSQLQSASSIATWRMNLLRAAYLLMSVGIGLTYTPTVLHHQADFPLGFSLAFSLLTGLGLVALLGLRFPIQMLPLLLFELIWKATYLTAFALPLYLSNRIDDATAEYVKACLMVVIFIPVVPWDHVWRTYVVRPAEPWR